MDRRYGDKYAETKGESTTQIAARIRADIKAAIGDGRLPVGTRVSVRTEYYSGGSAIRVAITAWPGQIANPERARIAVIRGVPYGDYGIPWVMYRDHSSELIEAVALLDAIMWQYNYDGSDSMSDYYDRRFSGHAEVLIDRAVKEAAQADAMESAREALEAEMGAERVVQPAIELADSDSAGVAVRNLAEAEG